MGGEKRGQWRIREMCERDIPAWVEVRNLEYPNEPTTIEQEKYWERAYPPDNPRLRLVAESQDGQVIAGAACEKLFWAIVPGVYTSYGVVRPQWRGRGLGRELLDRFQRHARQLGAERLWSECQENQPHSIAFFAATGFEKFGVRFEQVIDLRGFELARFPGAFERISGSGYRITTLAELRRQRPDADSLLYQVFNESSSDVPLPGGARISFDFEQWRKELDNPSSDPAYIFMALHGEEAVGETMLELPKNGPASTGSPGVLREHRKFGIALALKLASLQALKELGYAEALTVNDTENPAILGLNEKIGYRRRPGWLQWQKHLR